MAMMNTLVQRAKPYKGYGLAFLVGALALLASFMAALATGAENIGFINNFVEGLSGRSSSGLDRVGNLLPLGLPFVAGMVSTVNPCGFAMLPAYLGLYIGSNDPQAGMPKKIYRALLVGLIVTSGFVILFGISGAIVSAGTRAIIDFIPWVGLGIGILLVAVGSWLLGGGKLYSAFASQTAARIGTPGQVSTKEFFLFGLSYGIASLSCTLPIFLSVIGVSLAGTSILTSIQQFILYALGMGLVIVLMTVSMAIFKELIVRFLRKVQPYVQPVSAVFMIIAGCYIVYYWMTLGRGLF